MELFQFIEDEAIRSKAVEQYEAQMKEVNESVQAKIDKAVEGLQNKNKELLGEKKTIQEKLAEFKDISDPVKAMEALKFINENEDAQLIRDGKVGELIEKRTSTMRIEHDNAIRELADRLEATSAAENNYRSLYETKVMDDSIRAVAIKAGIRPEAVPDVLLRAKSLFTLDKEGGVEARDAKGNLRKNDAGNVVTPGVWMEDLKQTSPHYWPASEGAGALGAGLVNESDVNARLADLAKKGKMKEYRALRAKMGMK